MVEKNTRKDPVSFLDIMGAFVHDANLSMREFLKFIIDRAYMWYVNLKSVSVHDLEHLVSLFNTNFFCAYDKFSLTELN